MKKHLLPQFKQYKADLHTHSYVSDGYHTAEEYKELYMAEGYSILAYTDHDFLKDHSYLCDENFVAINGYEYAINEKKEGTYNDKAVCHLNLFAKDPTNLSHVCYNPARKPRGVSEEEALSAPHYGDFFQAEYSVECINHIIAEANKHGFLVCYNHPYWSREGFNTFSQYEGCFAIEVYNSGSRGSGHYEFTPYIYDELLSMGKKLIPIASDDVHKVWPDVKAHKQAFGGHNMIAVENLTYADVIKAMEKGNMYASSGARINEIYVEDNVLTLTCEPVEEVYFRTHNRRGTRVFDLQGEAITSASFELTPADKYVFMYIKTFDGKWAITRPYYAEELFDK